MFQFFHPLPVLLKRMSCLLESEVKIKFEDENNFIKIYRSNLWSILYIFLFKKNMHININIIYSSTASLRLCLLMFSEVFVKLS